MTTMDMTMNGLDSRINPQVLEASDESKPLVPTPTLKRKNLFDSTYVKPMSIVGFFLLVGLIIITVKALTPEPELKTIDGGEANSVMINPELDGKDSLNKNQVAYLSEKQLREAEQLATEGVSTAAIISRPEIGSAGTSHSVSDVSDVGAITGKYNTIPKTISQLNAENDANGKMLYNIGSDEQGNIVFIRKDNGMVIKPIDTQPLKGFSAGGMVLTESENLQAQAVYNTGNPNYNGAQNGGGNYDGQNGAGGQGGGGGQGGAGGQNDGANNQQQQVAPIREPDPRIEAKRNQLHNDYETYQAIKAEVDAKEREVAMLLQQRAQGLQDYRNQAASASLNNVLGGIQQKQAGGGASGGGGGYTPMSYTGGGMQGGQRGQQGQQGQQGGYNNQMTGGNGQGNYNQMPDSSMQGNYAGGGIFGNQTGDGVYANPDQNPNQNYNQNYNQAGNGVYANQQAPQGYSQGNQGYSQGNIPANLSFSANSPNVPVNINATNGNAINNGSNSQGNYAGGYGGQNGYNGNGGVQQTGEILNQRLPVNVIRAGTKWQAVITKSINTDEGLQVIAELVTGKFAGATVYGLIAPSGRNVGVQFTTIAPSNPRKPLMPIQAYATTIGSQKTAISTDVKNHYGQNYGIKGFTAILRGVGEAYDGAGETSVITDSGNVITTQDGTPSSSKIRADVLGELGKDLTSDIAKLGNRAPTYKVPIGTVVNVVLASDLDINGTTSSLDVPTNNNANNGARQRN